MDKVRVGIVGCGNMGTGHTRNFLDGKIKNGYITIEGGHRVGLAGTAVTENGSVEFIKNISAMNIRRATEVIGAADKVIQHIDRSPVKSALIISPPCCGLYTRSSAFSAFTFLMASPIVFI